MLHFWDDVRVYVNPLHLFLHERVSLNFSLVIRQCLLHYKWQLSLGQTASTAMQGQFQDSQWENPSPLTECVLFDMLHTHILIPRVTLLDPYAPKTEKQIPFYKGFILVMRHGPYLTLTAAFLFITVAIQVNSNVFIKHFSDMTLNVTVNGANPGSRKCIRVAGAQCWFDQCRRALTESSWFKACFKSENSWEWYQHSTSLAVYLSLVGGCFCFDTLGLDCLNYCRLSNFCIGSISVYFRPLIAEVSAVIHVSPGWE